MTFSMHVANGRKEFKETVATLTVGRECITIEDMFTMTGNEIAQEAQDLGCEVDDEFVDALASDRVYDLPLPAGILLDMDSSKPLYLSLLRWEHRVHHVGDLYIVTAKRHFEMRGGKYADAAVHSVDLRKFRNRYYTDRNAAEFKTGEILDYTFELDQQLLCGWVSHQMLKLVFPCPIEPFFEKDGLVHRKDNLCLWQPYVVPKTIDIFQVMQSLRIAEQYHDSDYLNAER